jgi:hypothetical protein
VSLRNQQFRLADRPTRLPTRETSELSPRSVRPCGEIIALGSHHQGPNVTVSHLVDGAAQVAEQVTAEQVQPLLDRSSEGDSGAP